MGYSIVGYFDDKASKRITDMWKLMADNQIDDYLIYSENRPHFKIDMYEDLDIELTKEKLKNICSKYDKIDVHFKQFGFYPNEKKPFVSLEMSDHIEVIKLHKEIHGFFMEMGKVDKMGFFTEGKWKPDIQLTQSFDKSKLPHAVKVLNEVDMPFDGVVERIGIIQFPPAKKLCSFELR